MRILENISSIQRNIDMSTDLEKLLLTWPSPFLTDQELSVAFGRSHKQRRHDAVKYAIRKNRLVPMRRGVYVIPSPYTSKAFDPFMAAQLLLGPSYISFESALSFHGWIPEAVYTTTSASAKRGRVFKTPKGVFRYLHVPETSFYLEVARVSNDAGSFLVAELKWTPLFRPKERQDRL